MRINTHRDLATILDCSLQEIEGRDWGEANFDSHLVIECHRLHRIPLRDFQIEDLRLMIGQNMCLEHLMPLAIEQLEKDPFAEGDCHPCDLLVNVLRVEAKFWLTNRGQRDQVDLIAKKAISLFASMEDLDCSIVIKEVEQAFGQFQRNRPAGP